MALAAYWVCACGQRFPFAHGDVFRYRWVEGKMVYERRCPGCGKTMQAEEKEED